jgi:hypothetical protein
VRVNAAWRPARFVMSPGDVGAGSCRGARVSVLDGQTAALEGNSGGSRTSTQPKLNRWSPGEILPTNPSEARHFEVCPVIELVDHSSLVVRLGWQLRPHAPPSLGTQAYRARQARSWDEAQGTA